MRGDEFRGEGDGSAIGRFRLREQALLAQAIALFDMAGGRASRSCFRSSRLRLMPAA